MLLPLLLNIWWEIVTTAEVCLFILSTLYYKHLEKIGDLWVKFAVKSLVESFGADLCLCSRMFDVVTVTADVRPAISGLIYFLIVDEQSNYEGRTTNLYTLKLRSGNLVGHWDHFFVSFYL